jgi:hypothetical protein
LKRRLTATSPIVGRHSDILVCELGVAKRGLQQTTRTMNVSSARRKKKKTKVSHGKDESDGHGHALSLSSFLFTNTGPQVSSREEREGCREASPRGIAYSYSSPSSLLTMGLYSSFSASTRRTCVVFPSVGGMVRDVTVLKMSEVIIVENCCAMSWELLSQRPREFWNRLRTTGTGTTV